MDVRLHHPFSAMACGPSWAGKTHFVFRFINNIESLMHPVPEKIIYCYGEYQDLFNNYPQIEFVQGLPDISAYDGKEHVLIIVDDLMSESGSSIEHLFTKGCHHRNISLIFLTQNIFYKSKHSRTMSLNTQYLIIFKNARDKLQIATLARQMYPGNANFLIQAFTDATAKPYSYLLIDLRNQTPDNIRVRTNIFPDDAFQYAYIPK